MFGLECEEVPQCSLLGSLCNETWVATGCRVTCGTCDDAPIIPGSELWLTAVSK